jgi:hypothetical protein
VASRIPIPDGCGAIEGEGPTLIAPLELLAELREAGLHSLVTWSGTSGERQGGTGRGAVSSFELPSRRRLVLKRLRRGGLTARFRNDRFRGTARLLANLTLPVELAQRGIATPRPAGLLLQEGPPGLFQGWLATEEYADACDGLSWLEASTGSGPDLLDPVLRFVRSIHDAGL